MIMIRLKIIITEQVISACFFLPDLDDDDDDHNKGKYGGGAADDDASDDDDDDGGGNGEWAPVVCWPPRARSRAPVTQLPVILPSPSSSSPSSSSSSSSLSPPINSSAALITMSDFLLVLLPLRALLMEERVMDP